MREEAKNWWKQGENDIKTARLMFKNSCYDSCAFYCHQSAEKLLKAAIIERERIIPPKIHNLLDLARMLKLEGSEIIEDVMDLNPHYLTSRYPDAANGVPSEIYTERMGRMCLEWTERIENFLKKYMNL
jgi:HEPN domain-containing protein